MALRGEEMKLGATYRLARGSQVINDAGAGARCLSGQHGAQVGGREGNTVRQRAPRSPHQPEEVGPPGVPEQLQILKLHLLCVVVSSEPLGL